MTSPPRPTLEQALAELEGLHARIDGEVAVLVSKHADRLHCRRGCSDCCVDDLTVFEIEAERIRARHSDLLERGAPHPPVACAFLDDDGACRVHAERPYVCRTQGLPLRWLCEDPTGEIVESRDICPLNRPGPPLSGAAESDCWLIGPWELRLRELQERLDGGEGRRVALRSLFARREPADRIEL